MRHQGNIAIAVTMTACVFAYAPVHAEVPDLGQCRPKCSTPIGAKRAGNGRDIPRWKGGMKKVPTAYQPGGRLVPPTALEKDVPLVLITHKNYQQYATFLSAGHQQLFAKYPSYTMPVYRTRRTTAFPKRIYKRTKWNAESASLAGTDVVHDAVIGFPFPYPLSGRSKSNPDVSSNTSASAAAKIMWNHKLRYRGNTVSGANDHVIVSNGKLFVIPGRESMLAFYANTAKGKGYAEDPSTAKLIVKYGASYRSARPVPGHTLTLHDYAGDEYERYGRLALKGDARPKAITNIVGDEPVTAAAGMKFYDEIDGFSGALKRYDWQLLGKREMLIAHNAYQGLDRSLSYKALMTPKHYNQAVARYEKHRVWVVEATLKEGQTHRVGRRVFYINEDCWCIAMVENYNSDGKLRRFQEAHLVNLYIATAVIAAPELTYDFLTGDYIGVRLTNESKIAWRHRQRRPSDSLTTSSGCDALYRLRY